MVDVMSNLENPFGETMRLAELHDEHMRLAKLALEKDAPSDRESLEIRSTEEWEAAQYRYWPEDKSYHVRHNGLFRPSLGYDEQFGDPATHGVNSSLQSVQPSRSAIAIPINQAFRELFWLVNRPMANRLIKAGQKPSAEEFFSMSFGSLWKSE
jgi:hypothetical protein